VFVVRFVGTNYFCVKDFIFIKKIRFAPVSDHNRLKQNVFKIKYLV
jgi:hypothetical protein